MGEDTLSTNGEAAIDSEVERLIARHTESMRERIEKLEQHIITMENSRGAATRRPSLLDTYMVGEGARDVTAIPISQSVLGGEEDGDWFLHDLPGLLVQQTPLGRTRRN